MTVTPALSDASSNQGSTLNFNTPVSVEAGQEYSLVLEFSEKNRVLDLCGTVAVALQTSTQLVTQSVPRLRTQCLLRSDSPYTITITPQETGVLQSISLSQVIDQTPVPGSQTLVLTITPPGDNQVGASASLTADLTAGVEWFWCRLYHDARSSAHPGTRPDLRLSLALQSGERRYHRPGICRRQRG